MVDWWGAVGKVAQAVSPILSTAVSYITGNKRSGGSGGGGTFTEDSRKKADSGGGGSGGGGSGGGGSGGGDGGDAGDASGSTSSSDNTAENVKKNDPEKNKQLAEIIMSEELRKTQTLTIRIPKILKGLHTNQFFFIELPDEFYEKNYPEIMEIIANEKFGRYAGFQKGRFFIEKTVEEGGIDGNRMEITLNPIASSHAEYIKMQQEAEKALIDALNDNSKYSGDTGSGGLGGTALEIGNALCDKYGFCSGVVCPDRGNGTGNTETYEGMKKNGSGSCFAWSFALYEELNKVGIKARIIQYATSMASNHRSVQIEENGQWVDYPYKQLKKASVAKYAGATKSKPGMFVFKEPP